MTGRVAVLALASVVLFAPRASAQPELYVTRTIGIPCMWPCNLVVPGELWAIDIDEPPRVVRYVPIEHPVSPAVVTADGRFVVWVAQRSGTPPVQYVSVFDNRTGTTTETDIPGLAAGPAVADRRKSRVYIPDEANDRVVVVEPPGLTFVAVRKPYRLDVSRDGEELLVLRWKTGGGTEVEVISLATQQSLRTLDSGVQRLIAGQPGQFIGLRYVSVSSTDSRYQIARYDSTTGAALATWTAPDPVWVLLLDFDPTTNRIFAERYGNLSGIESLLVIDAASMTTARTISDVRQSSMISRVVPDPRSGGYYVAGQYGAYYRYACGPPYVDAMDSSFAYTRIAQLTQPGCIGFALAVPAPAPTNLRAEVSGSTVTLTWSPDDRAEGRATDWIVEAFVGAQQVASFRLGRESTGLTVSNVPAATYRIAVVAVNEAGSGRRSQPITVLVP